MARLASLIFVTLIFFCSCNRNGTIEDGVQTFYFEKTNRLFKTIEYKDGKMNGLYTEYYKNGNVRMKKYFVNDTVRDTIFLYHENGKPARIQVFNKGKMEGCWLKFNKNGMLYSEACFSNNRQNGYYNTYTYKTGKPLQRQNYKDGELYGRQEMYYNSGKPKCILYYYNGDPGLGTEEWDDYGRKVNNDFKISIIEENKVLLENSLKFIIRLENPQPDDQLFKVSENDTGNVVTQIYPIRKEGDQFEITFSVFRGGFVMEKIKIAAFRKTAQGNTFIKTKSFTASANNY